MASSARHTEILSSVVLQILRPLVQVLLRNGMSFKAFSELAKRAFVEAGLHEPGIPGRKQTASRVSILSGLSRKEVQRLIGERAQTRKTDASERYNRAARVITGWIRDGDYRDAAGEPRVLSLSGSGGSFSELVRRYSGDVPGRAVLDELLRVGAVERIDDDRIRLLSRAYIPRTSDLDKLDILGADVADLIATIDHNLRHSGGASHFQRKVMYDNLPEEAVSAFRSLSARQAQELLENMDHWLSRHDRDVTPSVKGKGRARAGIGIYYFEENLDQHSKDK
jgi:hypothetical protein